MQTKTAVFKSSQFYLAVLILIAATLLNFISSELIQFFFPLRKPVIDTLFLLTPQVMWTQYLTDIAVIISPIILLFFILKEDLDYLPYYIIAFAASYAIRAFLIILNPIGGVFGNMSQYGITEIMQHGMFPSGHTLLVFVSYYLSERIADKTGRMIIFIACVIEVIALVLSRGHYAIDIVGGILLAYFIVNELKVRKAQFKL